MPICTEGFANEYKNPAQVLLANPSPLFPKVNRKNAAENPGLHS